MRFGGLALSRLAANVKLGGEDGEEMKRSMKKKRKEKRKSNE